MKIRLLAFITIFFVTLSHAQTAKHNKQIAIRYFEEVINQQKVELIPELFTKEFVYVDLHTFSETKDSVKSF